MSDFNAGKTKPVQKKYSAGFVFGVVVVAALVSFIVGTRSDNLSAYVGRYFGLSDIISTSKQLDFSQTQKVYEMLARSYDGELDESKLIQYASKGLVSATEDRHTEYFTAEEAEELRANLEGSIGGGIGAELGKREGRLVIVKPIKDTPAAKAGLLVNDIILGINDESTEGMSLDQAVSKIRGEVGTTVKLTIQSRGETKQVNITRQEITAPEIDVKKVGNIGVVSLSRFSQDSAIKVRAAFEDFKRQGVDGVVLDLRGNGGGYLEAGINIASLWLDEGEVVVREKGKRDGEETRTSTGSPILKDMPTVVLINGGSASASEIVAGALQDHEVATVVGEQSYGKGSVQQMIDLSNGDMLKVTIARWYTPEKRSISEEGIKPNVEVSLGEDSLLNGKDEQLDKAIEVLNSK